MADCNKVINYKNEKKYTTYMSKIRRKESHNIFRCEKRNYVRRVIQDTDIETLIAKFLKQNNCNRE